MTRSPPPRQNRLIVDDEPEATSSIREAVVLSNSPESVPAERAELLGVRDAARRGRGRYIGLRQVSADVPRQLFLWLKRISAETDEPLVGIHATALSVYVKGFAAELGFGADGPAEMVRGRPVPGGDRKRVNAHIELQLFLWLKRISAQTGKSMAEIFEDALTAYVNSFAASKKFGA